MPGGEIASYLDSLRDRLDKHRLALRSSLDDFYSALRPRLEAVRSEWQHVESESAPRFNAFRLLQPGENGLSRGIAELLRPDGSHGQSKLFLDLFLDRIGHPELAAQSEGAVVRIEDLASGAPEGGRLDITVRIGEFCVAIENKPWAGDQPNQLQRYAAHLRNRYADFCLIYVNKSGDPPPSESIPAAEREELEKAGRFKILSYAEAFNSWLRECRDAARSENVRGFLDSFVSYLDHEEQSVAREYNKEILKHAFESPERLRIALLVGSAYEEIRRRLIELRMAELQSRLGTQLGTGWEGRVEGGFCYWRRTAWPRQLEFGFGRDSEEQGYYLFLNRWQSSGKGSRIERGLREALDKALALGPGDADSECSWWNLDESHDWCGIDVLEQLATSDEPVRYIAERLERMARTIEPIIEQEISARSAALSGSQ
jgi:hypothetical protein